VARLLAGWAVAFVASLGGIAASWIWDLPTGAAIVVVFGFLLVCAAAVSVRFAPRQAALRARTGA